MAKHRVDSEWFRWLSNPCSRLGWLSQLSSSVDVIANFGCKSSEFLALLWYLDAAEIRVVQKDKEHLTSPTEERHLVQKRIPEALDGRSVHFIVEDMSKLKEEQLRSNSCDLAYCEEVLYIMWDNRAKFQKSINQMARVVKPRRWVIACEGKIRDPYPGGDLIDISQCFLAAGLEKVSLNGAPESCNCYRKPDGLSSPSLETTVQ